MRRITTALAITLLTLGAVVMPALADTSGPWTWNTIGYAAVFTTVSPEINGPLFSFTDLQPQSYVTSDELTKTTNAFDSFFDADTLNEFTGPGTIGLTAGTWTKAWIGLTGGNAIAEHMTQARALARVTYYYDEVVPEPSSALALLSGLGALAGLVKLRKR